MAVFTILNRQTRSNPVTTPASPPGLGNRKLRVTLNCPSWATETDSLQIVIERSSDDGATWRHWTDFTWVGGKFSRDGSLPAVEFSEADLTGVRIRGIITPTGSVNFGLDGETFVE